MVRGTRPKLRIKAMLSPPKEQQSQDVPLPGNTSSSALPSSSPDGLKNQPIARRTRRMSSQPYLLTPQSSLSSATCSPSSSPSPSPSSPTSTSSAAQRGVLTRASSRRASTSSPSCMLLTPALTPEPSHQEVRTSLRSRSASQPQILPPLDTSPALLARSRSETAPRTGRTETLRSSAPRDPGSEEEEDEEEEHSQAEEREKPLRPRRRRSKASLVSPISPSFRPSHRRPSTTTSTSTSTTTSSSSASASALSAPAPACLSASTPAHNPYQPRLRSQRPKRARATSSSADAEEGALQTPVVEIPPLILSRSEAPSDPESGPESPTRGAAPSLKRARPSSDEEPSPKAKLPRTVGAPAALADSLLSSPTLSSSSLSSPAPFFLESPSRSSPSLSTASQPSPPASVMLSSSPLLGSSLPSSPLLSDLGYSSSSPARSPSDLSSGSSSPFSPFQARSKPVLWSFRRTRSNLEEDEDLELAKPVAVAPQTPHHPGLYSALPGTQRDEMDEIERCVWGWSIEREREYLPSPGYQALQKQFPQAFRNILIDWIFEVSQEFKLHRETTHLCLNFIDRFLSRSAEVKKSRLQLVGIAALFIAAKLEEIYPPKVTDFSAVTDGLFGIRDIHEMELTILDTLKWKLVPPTANFWTNMYLQNLSRIREGKSCPAILGSAKDYVHFWGPKYVIDQYLAVMDLLDAAAHHFEALEYPPSLLAAAAVDLTVLKEEEEREYIHKASGFTREQLRDCRRWLEMIQALPGIGKSKSRPAWASPTDWFNLQTHNELLLPFLKEARRSSAL